MNYIKNNIEKNILETQNNIKNVLESQTILIGHTDRLFTRQDALLVAITTGLGELTVNVERLLTGKYLEKCNFFKKWEFKKFKK